MIHKEICTYEVCKLAKEKGFPQHIGNDAYIVDNEYDDKYEVGCHYPIQFIPDYLPTIVAPTQSLLQRWLREERGIQIYIDSDLDFDDETFVYEWQIANKENFDNGGFEIHRYNSEDYHSTYELALEDAIAFSLKNLV